MSNTEFTNEDWKKISPALATNEKWHAFVDYVTKGAGMRAVPELTPEIRGLIAYVFNAGYDSIRHDAYRQGYDDSTRDAVAKLGVVADTDHIREAFHGN